MPQIIALTCPVCGASLSPDSERCNFCGSYIVIKTDLPRLDRKSLNQSVIQEHISTFRQRVRSNQYDEEAYYGLGLAYYSLGLINDAIEELKRAARLMPENPHIQAQLAVALYDAVADGDESLKMELQQRIRQALLLDPSHSDALILKVEVLLDDDEIEEATELFQSLGTEGRERNRERVIAAIEENCQQCLDDDDYEGASWSWELLNTIDNERANQLAAGFLRQERYLVPSKIVAFTRSKKHFEADASLLSRSKPLIMGALWALAGGLLGLAVFFVVVITVDTDPVTNSVEASDVGKVILGFLFMLAAPVSAVLIYWHRSKSVRVVGINTAKENTKNHFTRSQIIAAEAPTEITFQVADEVIAKIERQIQREKFQADLNRNRR